MMHRLFPFLLLLLPALSLGAANEGAAPVGTIAAVKNLGPGALVVMNDTVYFTTPMTQIERSDGRVGTLADLTVGRQVRFSFGVDALGGLYLTRVQILPATSGPARPSAGRQSP